MLEFIPFADLDRATSSSAAVATGRRQGVLPDMRGSGTARHHAGMAPIAPAQAGGVRIGALAHWRIGALIAWTPLSCDLWRIHQRVRQVETASDLPGASLCCGSRVKWPRARGLGGA